MRDRVEQYSRRAEGVKADNLFRRRGVYEDIGNRRTPIHFFSGLGLQKSIKGFDSAVEALAIVNRVVQLLDD